MREGGREGGWEGGSRRDRRERKGGERDKSKERWNTN